MGTLQPGEVNLPGSNPIAYPHLPPVPGYPPPGR